MFSASGRQIDRATIIFLTLTAVAFIVATYDVRSSGEGVADTMREGTQSLFTPLQSGVDFVTRPVVGFVDGIANIAGLRDDNERLASRVRELEASASESESLREQVIQLEAINGLTVPGELATVTARIGGSGASTFDNIRFIDKGSEDGIVAGQAVVDEDGLVGWVDLVSAKASRIRLIIDPAVSVGVRISRTNETGIVTGHGDGPLRLEMFRANEGVNVGDRVVTVGSRFPPGIAVGTIEASAKAEVGFVLRTGVDPAVRLSQLDYVKVIVGWSPIDAQLQDEDATPQTTVVPETTSTTEGSG